MIADLKPYPTMKDSDVSWLGEVPSHWEVRRLGQIGRFSKGNGGNKEDGAPAGVPCVRYGDLYTTHTHFILKSLTFVSMAKAKDYTPITFGDVLFSASGETIDEIGKSAVNLMQSEACCGGDVILFRPERQVEARYMGYATDCRPAVAQKATMGRGVTVKHIYGGQLKYLTLALPPLPEQAAIVRFLDHANRRIRRYIRAKQKLITLLEEQKQILIHRAVTRGLDPNVRLKPSGVEWLGEVPAHWAEAIKIKYVSSLKGRLGWQGLKAGEYTSEGPYIVSSAHFRNHKINWKICPHVTQERYEMDKHIQLAHGDILLMKDGAAMGKLAFVDELPGLACLNSHLLLFRPLADNGGIAYLPQFMFYYMQTECFQGYAQVNGTGATFLGISQESIGNHTVCLPPISEQTAVVEYLHHETADLDTTTASANRQIDLLREYRTRLIADVVTGKLDVREAAARLPDEDEELEPLDETDTLINGKEEPSGGLDATAEEAAV